jgi:hypothetical protein
MRSSDTFDILDSQAMPVVGFLQASSPSTDPHILLCSAQVSLLASVTTDAGQIACVSLGNPTIEVLYEGLKAQSALTLSCLVVILVCYCNS